MITLAGQAYPHMAGTVIGSIKVAIPIGGIVVPLVVSLLSRVVPFETTLIVFPAVLLAAFFMLLLVFRKSEFPDKP